MPTYQYRCTKCAHEKQHFAEETFVDIMDFLLSAGFIEEVGPANEFHYDKIVDL